MPGDLPPRAQSRRVDCIECAVAHRLVDFAQVTGDRRRDHQDRARRFTHDPPRGLDPVCPRHE